MNTELKVNDEYKQYLIKKGELDDGVQYIFKFPNDYGASVIKTRYSYGYKQDLWEMGLIFFVGDGDRDWHLTYERDFEDDVKGYLTDEEVNRLLEKIIEY